MEVQNAEVDGLRVDAIVSLHESKATVSRIRHDDKTIAATGATIIHRGDRISVVGTTRELDRIEAALGKRTDEDLMLGEDNLTTRKIVVTAREVLGKEIGSLKLDTSYGVACTRITRAGVELSAVPGLQLNYGDQIQIVGTPAALEKAAKALGNSIKELNETQFIPLFIGIVLGVIEGTMPIAVPGLPAPVKLGLAGGPLIVALVLGRLGHFRRQVWYMPQDTNLAFREFGIALFFAAAGLTAGAKFFSTVFSVTGMQWVIAGSMTDPPALAFAANINGSNAPAVAYATVYPLTTLMRILSAQILAVILTR